MYDRNADDLLTCTDRYINTALNTVLTKLITLQTQFLKNYRNCTGLCMTEILMINWPGTVIYIDTVLLTLYSFGFGRTIDTVPA